MLTLWKNEFSSKVLTCRVTYSKKLRNRELLVSSDTVLGIVVKALIVEEEEDEAAAAALPSSKLLKSRLNMRGGKV